MRGTWLDGRKRTLFVEAKKRTYRTCIRLNASEALSTTVVRKERGEP